MFGHQHASYQTHTRRIPSCSTSCVPRIPSECLMCVSDVARVCACAWVVLQFVFLCVWVHCAQLVGCTDPKRPRAGWPLTPPEVSIEVTQTNWLFCNIGKLLESLVNVPIPPQSYKHNHWNQVIDLFGCTVKSNDSFTCLELRDSLWFCHLLLVTQTVRLNISYPSEEMHPMPASFIYSTMNSIQH